jgi:hypothetical protein
MAAHQPLPTGVAVVPSVRDLADGRQEWCRLHRSGELRTAVGAERDGYGVPINPRPVLVDGEDAVVRVRIVDEPLRHNPRAVPCLSVGRLVQNHGHPSPSRLAARGRDGVPIRTAANVFHN